MTNLILGAIEEPFGSVDEAMNACFELFPNADFSDWQENDSQSWLNVKLYGEIIGRIVE